MPPVSSRTTTMSRPPSMISGLRGEASASSSKTMAGRRFAKSPSSFLSPSRARSGLSSPGRSSHFGPPTAPRRTASDAFAISTVSSGRHLPVSSIAAPPASTYVYSKVCPNLSPTASRTLVASSITSGPMPSPFTTAILYFNFNSPYLSFCFSFIEFMSPPLLMIF